MKIFIYPILLLAILLFCIILPLYFLYLIDSFIRGYDLSTSRRATKEILKIISKYKTGANNFYDLGCAAGGFAIIIKKSFSCFTIYAIDNSSLRIFFAKLRTFFSGQKIFFLKEDLLKTDLQSADIVFTYLKQDLMPLLEEKLQKELKRGVLIITNTTSFPNWQPIETRVTFPKQPRFEKLFIYIKKD